MLDAKTRLLTPALAVIAAVALSGCEASKDGDRFPAQLPDTFVANFSVTTGLFPFPSDLPAFVGSTDGTLNISAPLNAPPFLLTGPSLNTLDGFSTTAPLTTSFNQPIRAESINARYWFIMNPNSTMPEIKISRRGKRIANSTMLCPFSARCLFAFSSITHPLSSSTYLRTTGTCTRNAPSYVVIPNPISLVYKLRLFPSPR